MITYVESIFILTGLSAVKVSVAFCLLRFSISLLYKRILYCSIIFIIVFTLACCGGLIWQCIPVQAAWNMNLKPPTGTARCMSTKVFLNLALMNSGGYIVRSIVHFVTSTHEASVQRRYRCLFCRASDASRVQSSAESTN